MQFIDSLTNLVAGLGMPGRDKKVSDRFDFRPLGETEVDAMCDGDWVARKIVDAPADDTMRAWRTWQSNAKLVTAIEDSEQRHQVKAKILEATKLARRYGGSVILIGADTSNPELPLRPESVKRGGLEYLTVVPRRYVVAGPPQRDPRKPGYLQPSYYELQSEGSLPVRVHPSRVVRFIGQKRYDQNAENEGWGYSSLQAPYDAVHHVALSAGAGASLLHEAKTDVIQVPNLGAALATPEGTATLQRRFSLASLLKSINGTLLLGDGEVFTRTTTSFTGIADMLERYLQIAAAAADIPAARFLGQSASGLNASGDSDMRNYYDRLASDRERELRPALEQLDAILWRDATGKAKPKNAVFEFDPLWQPSEKEQADVAKTYADVATAYLGAAVIPEEALAKAIANRLIEDGVFPGLEAALSEAAANDPAREDAPERETAQAA